MSTTKWGSTPAGGVRSEATYLGADGAEVHDPRAAATMKIYEFGPEGEVLSWSTLVADGSMGDRRRSDTGPAWSEPGTTTSDGEMVGHDMGKTTWDIWYDEPNGEKKLATTLDQYMQAFNLSGIPQQELRAFLANAMTWESWEAAPQPLRGQVSDFLVKTRPTSAAPDEAPADPADEQGQ